jgi:uncharacterized protein YbbC (DUF1343 family)
VFDIQDIGARFYTYPWTLALVMQAAREAGMGVIVADRPNPIGGIRVEGPVLDPALASFVGAYPIPIRHGMTLGELALMMNTDFGIGCDLTVVTCTNWRRPDDATQTGLPWVPPSPNMPTIDTAFIYPGTCLIEGTNLSEGRGTTKPFELIGAPFIDAHGLADRLNQRNLPGAHFRPAWFTPSFSKFQGQLCAGVQVHITDRAAFAPVETGIAILLDVARHHDARRRPLDDLDDGGAGEAVRHVCEPPDLYAGQMLVLAPLRHVRVLHRGPCVARGLEP